MADAHGSGPCVRKDVGVQLPPRPQPRAPPHAAGLVYFRKTAVMADITTVKVQTSTRDLLLELGAARRQSADQVIAEIQAIREDRAALHAG